MAAVAASARTVDYVPRPQFLGFHNRTQRWAAIVAHRRAGKTVACVMDLLTAALTTKKTEPRYAYVAPFREQAKTTAWTYLKHYSRHVVKDPAADFRESELAVRLYNGAQVRLWGADNPDALRGMYLDGAVLDEFADMRPGVWSEVIAPTLADRRGWAVFIGTPRGHNGFHSLVHGDEDRLGAIRDPDWYCSILKASETGILPVDELALQRKQMTGDEYAQEYECSFEAAIRGAIFGKELEAAAERICSVPVDGAHLVHTAWDIGVGDDTAIWCFQQVGREIRIVDYYANNGERVTHYLSWLRSRGYHYDTAWLPHDANNRQMTGLTVVDAVREAGFRADVLPRLGLEDSINAARMVLPRIWFDRERCAKGLDMLRLYRWKFNERMGVPGSTPEHDKASHAGDAFRYLAQAASLARSSETVMKLAPIDYPDAHPV